ncbi:MAG: membrane protein insertase YidC, partial [Pseudomonadota bacterium]
MTDIRRTVLWVVFSMSLVMLWDGWNKHNGRPSMFSPTPVTAPATPVGTNDPAASVAVPAAVPGAAPGAPASAVGAATSTPAAAPVTPASIQATEKVTISTDVLRATIDTRGGALVRLELVGQADPVDDSRNVVLFDQSAQRLYTAETGLARTGGGVELPNQDSPMTVEPGPTTLANGEDELQVRLVSETNGVKLTKTYTFRRGDFVIGVLQEVSNGTSAPISPELYFQLQRDGNAPAGESSMYSTFTGPALYTDASKFKKIAFSDIEKRGPRDKIDHEVEADNGWVAIVQHYFVTAWLLGNEGEEKRPRRFETKKIGTNRYAVNMIVPLGTVAPDATVALPARLFAGPQEEYKLEKVAPGLQLVKDYGLLKILSEPLFWLLTQLHKIFGNWGWSIIGLVVILKVVFYWLNASAYRSMAKMKAVAPRVTELRERLKDKPQQMQQEMMRIYREEKVNPIGGCLPMLAQMPFFIALYWVLLSSVEMRGAPWIGWVTDLSRPDTLFGTLPFLNVPIGLLPILMTLTSLVQTWLNPTPPDPLQAKMMWIMPLVFSVMFF